MVVISSYIFLYKYASLSKESLRNHHIIYLGANVGHSTSCNFLLKTEEKSRYRNSAVDT